MFNILVVEDNSDMRELFCTVLSDNGYRSVPAKDGLEALEVMDNEYIDLIISDIMMPDMSCVWRPFCAGLEFPVKRKLLLGKLFLIMMH